MTKDFLSDIIAHKKQINFEKREFFHSITTTLSQSTYGRYRLFAQQISRPGRINLIAEIKKASPSKGLIREDFDVITIAKIYTAHHAAAISVLTEDKYFLGKPAYLKKVSDDFDVPTLMKDFVIEAGQIYEARYQGASAVLLIVAILEQTQLKEFIRLAASLDLDALVEVHDERELERALEAGAEVIGINNRNLRTFDVDLAVSERLIPQIPKGKVIVAESGIGTHADVERLKEAGAHAVLIGEIFMRAQDIGAKIKEVMGD